MKRRILVLMCSLAAPAYAADSSLIQNNLSRTSARAASSSASDKRTTPFFSTKELVRLSNVPVDAMTVALALSGNNGARAIGCSYNPDGSTENGIIEHFSWSEDQGVQMINTIKEYVNPIQVILTEDGALGFVAADSISSEKQTYTVQIPGGNCFNFVLTGRGLLGAWATIDQDGKWLMTYQNNKVQLYSLALPMQDQTPITLDTRNKGDHSLLFGSALSCTDGDQLPAAAFVFAWQGKQELQVWKDNTLTLIADEQPDFLPNNVSYAYGFSSLNFSRDGKSLYVTANNEIIKWDCQSGKPTVLMPYNLHTPQSYAVSALNAAETILLISDANNLWYYDLATQQVMGSATLNAADSSKPVQRLACDRLDPLRYIQSAEGDTIRLLQLSPSQNKDADAMHRSEDSTNTSLSPAQFLVAQLSRRRNQATIPATSFAASAEGDNTIAPDSSGRACDLQ